MNVMDTKEKLERAKQAKEFQKRGMSVRESLKEVGLTPGQYYKTGLDFNSSPERAISISNGLKRHYAKRRSKITVTELPQVATKGKIFTFYGEPELVAQLIRGIQ